MELLEFQTGMTSKHTKEYVAAFKDFARLILAKLEVFEIANNRPDQSFIFGFWHLIQVDSPPLPFFNSIMFYLSYVDA